MLELFLTQWANPADTERNIAWTRESYAAMRPFFGAGRYVNYLDDDEAGDAAAEAPARTIRACDRLRRSSIRRTSST